MKKALLFFLLSSWVFNAFASENDVDSMLAQAWKLKSKAPEEFSALLDSLAESDKRLNDEQKLKFEYLDGYRVAFSGKPLLAIEKYQHVIANTVDAELRLYASTALLNIFAITRNYSEGFDTVTYLLPQLATPGSEAAAQAHLGLAIFYNQVNEYDNAYKSASEALSLTSDLRSICFGNNLIFEAQVNQQKIISKENFEQGLEACRLAEENVVIASTVILKAKNLLNKDDAESAQELLIENKAIFDAINYPRIKAEYHSLMSMLLFKSNSIIEAEVQAKAALDIASQMGATKPNVDALYVLYLIEEFRSNSSRALAFYKQYAQLEKAYVDEVSAKQLSISKAKNEALEKANQIKLLDKENALLKTEARLRKKELQNSYLVILSLVMLAAVIIAWLMVTRRIHRKFKTQARTDKLTGVTNRHYFTELAQSNLRYHSRTGQDLAFVIFDLDLFKRINDTYGHIVGDWVLQEVVKTVQRVCRGQDIIGRMGGEEFALLLPGCTVEKAIAITENYRSAIAAIDTTSTGHAFSVTASFGVSDSRQCGYSFDKLYASADEALYQSKETGRNKICGYKPEVILTSVTEQPA